MKFLSKIHENWLIKVNKKLKLAKKVALYMLIITMGIIAPYTIAWSMFSPMVAQYHSLLVSPVNAKLASSDASERQTKNPPAESRGFPSIALAPERVIRTYWSQATVYNSVPWQTDSDPFTTAAGTKVRDGIVAANCLPFGTQLRLPELFGDKIFVVEDRLHPSKTCFVIDIWQEYSPDSPSFGAPITKIEILAKSPRQHFGWIYN